MPGDDSISRLGAEWLSEIAGEINRLTFQRQQTHQSSPANPISAHPSTRLPTRVFIGLSGGQDSSVLLHLMSKFKQQAPATQVVALHVDHGQSEQAENWLARCSTLCEQLGIELRSRRLGLALGASESILREGRYAFFREVLTDPGDILLLAHHAQDQAETVLLRTLQGRGAQGMPRSRACGNGMILRPLLNVPKAAIEEYAAEYELAWVEDPTNQLLAADRNWLRNDIVPRLESRMPAVQQRLSALGERAQLDQASVQQLLVTPQVPVRLSRQQLLTAADGVMLLRNWLQAAALPGLTLPSQRQLQELLRQLADSPTPILKLNTALEGAAAMSRVASVAAGYSFRGYREHLYLVQPQPELAAEYPLAQLSVTGQYQLPHGVLCRLTKGAAAAAPSQLSLRFADSASTPPSTKRWQALKVPSWLRPTYPVLEAPAAEPVLPLLVWPDTPVVDLLTILAEQLARYAGTGCWLWVPGGKVATAGLP